MQPPVVRCQRLGDEIFQESTDIFPRSLGSGLQWICIFWCLSFGCRWLRMGGYHGFKSSSGKISRLTTPTHRLSFSSYARKRWRESMVAGPDGEQDVLGAVENGGGTNQQ